MKLFEIHHNKKLQLKVYDAVVPIGNTCHSSMLLRMANLQHISYPFDWSGHEQNNINHDNVLSERIKLICSDFENFLNHEDFSYKSDFSEQKHKPIFNTKTGLHYYHDFPTDKTIDEFFPEFKEKYQRRAQRLLETLKKGKKIALVWIQDTWDQAKYNKNHVKPSIAVVEKQLKLLNKKFPNTKFDFFMFTSDDNLVEDEIVETNYKNIYEYTSNHSFVYEHFFSKKYNQYMIKSVYEVLSKICLKNKC